MKPRLTLKLLKHEAEQFSRRESRYKEKSLYGVTDGKAVGTYFEHKFQQYLRGKYDWQNGSSAKGIDFPGLQVDMKVTSIKQPQSSCPFTSARQKIYGLDYSLLIFVYKKTDDRASRTGNLDVKHVVFVAKDQTADFQTTSELRRIIANSGNVDDIVAFMADRCLPVDEVQAQLLAEEILANPPKIGYLTISNALQWRLQYRRVIDKADEVEGVERIL
ncbi:MAG TPA: hypothetical protein VJL29_04175 [Thermoguttaceae bacterium]|nr:hypothetical protein [Thermoguttaceae bacterium]